MHRIDVQGEPTTLVALGTKLDNNVTFPAAAASPSLVVFSGGVDALGNASSQLEVILYPSFTVANQGPLTFARYGHAMGITDDYIIVYGGLYVFPLSPSSLHFSPVLECL